MTDGIGRLNGYGSYGLGGYVPNRNQNNNNNVPEDAPALQNHEQTQVDPSKVMDFLASNNYFIPQTDGARVGVVNLGQDVLNRVENYMDRFEMIYGVVEQEFGVIHAPIVMDLIMDTFIGMDDKKLGMVD